MDQCERFAPNYINDSPVFRKHVILLNTSEDNTSESGHIKIAPRVDGRTTIAPISTMSSTIETFKSTSQANIQKRTAPKRTPKKISKKCMPNQGKKTTS